MGFTENAALNIASQTRKSIEQTNQLLGAIVDQGQRTSGEMQVSQNLLRELLAEARRTNELLAYLTQVAYGQVRASAAGPPTDPSPGVAQRSS